jgi:hypothetical protein
MSIYIQAWTYTVLPLLLIYIHMIYNGLAGA